MSVKELPLTGTLGSYTSVSASQEDVVSELYDAYFDRIFAYLRYRLSDPGIAEDLAVEVFTRAWQKFRDVGSAEAAKAWLFVTARNLLIDHYRRNPKTLALDLLPVEHHPEVDSVEDTVLKGERREVLHRYLAELSEREREVIGLRFAAGLHNREIAPILGTSEGNIAKIIHRTLRKLRGRMGDEVRNV